MTTFHELLGTHAEMSAAEIKKRFKIMSTRVHPDKGGSDALMQMISQAYAFVARGEGSKEVFTTITLESSEAVQLKSKIILLERENRRLKEAYEHSQQQLEQAKDAVQRQFNEKASTPNSDDTVLRTQLNEYRALLQEKEQKIAELTARHHYQLEKHTNLVQRRRRLMVPLTAVLGGGILFGTVFGDFSSPSLLKAQVSTVDKKGEPDNTTQTIVPVLQEAPEQSMSSAAQVSTDLPSEQFDIKNSAASGVWDNFTFQASDEPYIAVRSQQGSYVVKGCETGFYLFLKEQKQPIRLPPNLQYKHREGDFIVYDILYGNGSTVENWFDSNRLVINGEGFTNSDFSKVLNQHNRNCLTRTEV
ncbi:hypothetical protein [Thaumasiovibrio sp. DFM-14]|uniref:J domain-containing protein n=1 Tax=Thaumasiovibrio sp. DFM-14 TaxID=3384792 RepID=UPI00399F98FE